MAEQKIHYDIYLGGDRERAAAEGAGKGWTEIGDCVKGIVDDKYTDVYLEFNDDPPPALPDLLADADLRILDLEYQNLILRGGLEP